MLTPAGCQSRRDRLAAIMEQNGWDLFLTGNRRTAYYFSGTLAAADQPVAFLLRGDGRHDLLTAEVYSASRPVVLPYHDLLPRLRDALGSGARFAAVELAGTPGIYSSLLPAAVDASADIYRLRKRKEPDEVAEIRESLGFCAAAYRAAREVIRPGLTELDVYNAMNAAVVKAAGTTIHFAGDFACGERAITAGGPPTARTILPGDLYILDLFPARALYFGDTCRTFAAGEPTSGQVEAFQVVREAVALGERAVKPGVRAAAVHAMVKEFLDSHEITRKSFWHHSGHGIGHHGHEAPRIQPGSDDIFEAGDVITLEPGCYGTHLQGGIRLEDNYLVTESGLENLFAFPMELRPGV